MRKFLSSNKDFFLLVFWGVVVFVIFIALFKVFGPGGGSSFDNDAYP